MVTFYYQGVKGTFNTKTKWVEWGSKSFHISGAGDGIRYAIDCAGV